jgi:surface polysaccharide O-acyltransferase-like enzyme
VQASRVLLYALYFFIGAGIGAGRFSEGVLAAEGRLANSSWVGWGIVTLIPYAGLWGLIYIKRGILDNPDTLPMWYEASYSVLFVIFSAGMMFTILAFFMRLKREGWSILDPMQNDAYGIFLVHYAFVLWIQYWLFDFDWPAIVKALIAFLVTMATSWIATRLLRMIPGSQRVL